MTSYLGKPSIPAMAVYRVDVFLFGWVGVEGGGLISGKTLTHFHKTGVLKYLPIIYKEKA